MSIFLDLHQKCKAAITPSRELDFLIAEVILPPKDHWAGCRERWKQRYELDLVPGHHPAHEWDWDQPLFTTYVDQAKQILGPRGEPFFYTVSTDRCNLNRARVSADHGFHVREDGASEALALCAAAFLALHLYPERKPWSA